MLLDGYLGGVVGQDTQSTHRRIMSQIVADNETIVEHPHRQSGTKETKEGRRRNGKGKSFLSIAF